MGESDRYIEYKPSRSKFTLGFSGNALVQLISINIIVFIGLRTIQLIFFFFQSSQADFNSAILQYFELPATVSKLAVHPWTLFSYMFSQTDILGIFSSMLWLWGFGYIFQELTGNKKIIPVYIYGGLAGALFFILAYLFIPPIKAYAPFASTMGANAAVMAVAVATTLIEPNFKVFRNLNGGIPIWVITLVYLLIDYAGIAGLDAAHSLSHIGGALAGFLFIHFLNKGKDGSIWMNRFFDKVTNLFNPAKPDAKHIREKIFYATGSRAPYKKTSPLSQQRVDEILDKINQKGYDALTKDEKAILKKASEEGLDG